MITVLKAIFDNGLKSVLFSKKSLKEILRTLDSYIRMKKVSVTICKRTRPVQAGFKIALGTGL